MRIDPVPIHMRQQAQRPQQPLYQDDASQAKTNAKLSFMEGIATGEQKAFINYALALSEARVASAKQFLAAQETYQPWLVGSVSELGNVLIGNILDRYG